MLIHRLSVARVAAGAGAMALVLGAGPVAAAPAAVGYDYGDAPFDVGGGGAAARAQLGGPRLGSTVSADQRDPDTGTSTKASESADGDDDDGLSEVPTVPIGRLTRFSLDVAVSQVDVPARLCGWVDLDPDRIFTEAERSCVDVPAGARSVRLGWEGRPGQPGDGFLRLRIGSVPDQVEAPDGTSSSGEVEDYLIGFVDPPPVPRAQLALTTTVSPRQVDRLGESLAYRYRIVNVGDLPLTGIRLEDPRVPADRLVCRPNLGAALAPRAVLDCGATVAVTQDDLDFGAVETAAEAHAEEPGGDPDDPSDDVVAVGAASVRVTQRPALRTTLRADLGGTARPEAGDRVAVTLTVRNVGNVRLTHLRADGLRPALDQLACQPAGSAAVAPNQEFVCEGSFRVPVADARRGRLVIRAAGRAERPYGSRNTASDDVTATSTLQLALTAPPREPAPDPAPPPTPAPAPPPADGNPGHPALAATGGPPLVPALAGLAALLAGVIVVALARRRR